MKKLLSLLFACSAFTMSAQENLTFQKPSQAILDLVDVNMAPMVSIDDNYKNILLLSRNQYKSLEELSQKELKLGGLRINPTTNIGSRVKYFNNVQVKSASRDTRIYDIQGLPENPKLYNFTWSPNQTKVAFTHTTSKGVELWYLDINTRKATRLTEARVNANLGDVINWFKDDESILVKMLPRDKKALINAKDAIPSGPIVSESKGKKAQNRTYQDLLKNKVDEANFEQLATSTLYRVNVSDKVAQKWSEKAIYSGIAFSPDGKYVLVAKIKKPFSYIVQYSRFPIQYDVYTSSGSYVSTVADIPLTEALPQGFMAVRQGRRSISWRSDQAATLTYAKALDGGDPKKEVEHRDELFELKAPFKGEGRSLLKTKQRFAGVEWGNDKLALAYDYWWNTRNIKTYSFNPSKSGEKKLINDRNYNDKYKDPGSFVKVKGKYGKKVLDIKGNKLFLIGKGFTAKGQFPFVDELNISTNKKKRLYTSTYKDKIERIKDYYSDKKQLLVRVESPTDYPNYYLKSISRRKRQTKVTDFQNPFSSIKDVYKKVIEYKRADGLNLSGTLYLPVGYDMEKKEKLPLIIWAYPREYKDKRTAGQNAKNPNSFTYPFYGSMIYWVTKGYAVLDGASFPILGEGDKEPNDSFREQLIANGKAAIDAVDELGVIDRDRVAIGGHSYGAFMVANLLSHSDLFAAGIARSGAYNRTLTPFGFQSEERFYWDVPEVYNGMSPFMHADKMKYPMLLIHGEADNNAGTHTMQSERYFNALKGLGANVRLVLLPRESHGYVAKENILHMLWEQEQWLDKYVKNKKKK